MSQDNNRPGQVPEGHVYDGIEENDYPLPTWWTWLFLLTIIFAFMYFIHYQTGAGVSLQQELQVAMEELKTHRANLPAPMETEESLLALLQDEKAMKIGAEQFSGKCAVCHGKELQGMIGPNLTDEYWLHGKATMTDIAQIVRKGVPEKGMPAWEAMMSRDEVLAVVAYVHSKNGSHPANAKEPQGNKIE